MNFFAILNNRRGQRYLDDTGMLDRAAAAFERAIHHAPGWSGPGYNRGLVYQRPRRWPESLYPNPPAPGLYPTQEAGRWKAGIAPTAPGGWETARLAWQSFGI